MAYISKERVKEIREELKKEFPEYKFSVRCQNHSTVDISIMEGPIDLFADQIYEPFDRWGNPVERISGNIQVNEYYLKERWNGKTLELLTKVKDIASVGCYNRNFDDPFADYSDYTFFVDISIGKWNKDYQVKERKIKTTKKTTRKPRVSKKETTTKKVTDEYVTFNSRWEALELAI